ncbi:uracil-DNA glycosylase [Thermodesulfobacterium hydrogeniphilum]|uniref:uracil-DNA glycosylase n=1 Tax=Thermodesulfobacterium hydrogeniphilum TaxID=161156 RepID=UPI00056DFAD8|nr:uracil-DNA glycosylase [Thermodesulfobacterium hydrogeniphilum]
MFNSKTHRLEKLYQELKNCQKCPLALTRTQVVCGEGNINSNVFLIGLAPGKDEDKKGRMFVGRAGKVLDELLKKASLHRSYFYMSNLIKCMLPNNRPPKKDEIEACTSYLDEEIEIINPDILVPLGFFATKYIFSKYGISCKIEMNSICGKIFFAENKKIMPLHHPASLLYSPNLKSIMERTYIKLKNFL